MIFIRERTLDQSELEAYAKMAPPSLEGWPIKFLAGYGRQDVLERPEPEGVAIAEFRSLEDARRRYDSPAYQAAAQHRLKAPAIAASSLRAFSLKRRLRFSQPTLDGRRPGETSVADADADRRDR